MRLLAPLYVVLLFSIALAWSVSGDNSADEPVQVARLGEANWDQFAPEGKEADAIYGDYVLRNDRLVAVIAEPLATRNANMTVRNVGGCLIDLTETGAQRDQLSSFYPGGSDRNYRQTAAVRIGESPRELDAGESAGGETAAVEVTSSGDEQRPEITTRYTLAADTPVLEIRSTFRNVSQQPIDFVPTDQIRADGGKEEMVKSPNGTSELFWIHDEYWQQAYAVDAELSAIQANSNSRTSTLKYLPPESGGSIKLGPGESYTLIRHIAAAENLPNARAAAAADDDRRWHGAHLEIVDALDRPVAGAKLLFSSDGESLGSGRTDEHGHVDVRLPKPQAEIAIEVFGNRVHQERWIEKAATEVIPAGEVDRDRIVLRNWKPGTLSVNITDGDRRNVPVKVEFQPIGETPKVDFGPETAEYAVKNLRYDPDGTFEQLLPPGEYRVIVSHGPEYDALFRNVQITAGETGRLVGQIARSVDSTGWVSSDFHSHSSPSGDNTSSQLGRVLNLLCENIEFAPCTEHNRISTYVPHLEALGVTNQMGTCSGMELTGKPLPLNHQNAFPLHRHPHHQDGGAPLTDDDPEQQIERLALWDDRSEKLIQQNHPDIGWLFFDRDGDGRHDSGYQRSFALMDVIEVHPVHNAFRLTPEESLPGRSGNNRLFNWIQLINQGHRVPGVVNTDAHYNYHGSGWLRNWVQSPTDEPGKIDTLDIVRASEEGRIIMSNGPFLEVSAQEAGSEESITAGQDLAAASGKVELSIRVQCPNWFDIDRVFVLVNGAMSEHDFSRQAHSEKFRDGTVKFEETLTLNLEEDAHLIVIAGGEHLTLGPVMGPTWGEMEPTAVANPMFIDVDGNGFEPNKDTLGAPLPVKSGS